TVAVFSIVDAWLLKPLDFPEPERLVVAFGARPDRPTEPQVFMPYRSYLAWKTQSHSFSSIAAAFLQEATVTKDGDGQTALGLSVTREFFSTLGAVPMMGRTFSDADANGPPVVLLGYGFWQRHMGGLNPSIGVSINLN